jgi:hypothetical protein
LKGFRLDLVFILNVNFGNINLFNIYGSGFGHVSGTVVVEHGLLMNFILLKLVWSLMQHFKTCKMATFLRTAVERALSIQLGELSVFQDLYFLRKVDFFTFIALLLFM